VATFPCTKYSPIADVHGTRNGDDLFLHFLRHVAISLPEAYVVENVPGMKAFPVVMEALTALPYYYVHVECPVDALTWLPQRRKRLIILATRKHFTWRPPEAQTRVRLKDVVEQDPRVEIPDYVYTRLKEGYRSKSIVSDPEKDDVAPCCVAHYAKDRSTRLVADKRFPMGVRPYSVREWARLQGVPDTFKWPVIDRSAYRMIGNGVAVPLGRWVGQELCRYFNQG
jgi:DNA (cytosine-5)-methyltransferase 1